MVTFVSIGHGFITQKGMGDSFPSSFSRIKASNFLFKGLTYGILYPVMMSFNNYAPYAVLLHVIKVKFV
jgi:hypothetical protein